MKGFVGINFSEYFKSTRENLYSKLSYEENLRKVAESLYIFLTKPAEIFLINMYITIIFKFWIFLMQNYNWLTLNLWLKTN